jgi:exodeoxyribonuclease VII large subunit
MPDAPKERLWTVTQLTNHLKDALEEAFARLWIVGEISNLTRASSGHVYFNLKDKNAILRTIMWRSDAQRLRFELREGLEVMVHGRLTMYPPRGDCQLSADRIIVQGHGEQNLALTQLKEKLQKAGYFARERKRPIPRFPRRLGLLTSPTGAAIRDMLEILGRRWPQAEVVVCPVRVQGPAAASDLARGLARLQRLTDLDAIIIGRGGGSSEDLAAFNEEIVARAIFHAQVPIISAVGHEIDVTIADLVADRRALTPSEAAELATPDREELLRHLNGRVQHLKQLMRGKQEAARKRLRDQLGHRVLRRPGEWVRNLERRLDDLVERLERAGKQRLERSRRALQGFTAHLQSLSPLNVLTRGYSLTRTEKERHVIGSVGQVQPGDRVEIVLSDGRLLGTIEECGHHAPGA